jgi:hypothetical protein
MYKLQFLFLVGFLMLLGGFRTLKRQLTKMLNTLKPNPSEQVKANLIRAGISKEKAHEIGAIFAHETGGFTSRLFQEQNNLMGMRHPASRQTTSQGSKNDYAFYCCISDAVNDFLLWFKQFGCTVQDLNQMSISEIITFMKSHNYFEDNFFNYLSGVKKWIKKGY